MNIQSLTESFIPNICNHRNGDVSFRMEAVYTFTISQGQANKEPKSLNVCGPMHQCGDAQMSVPMRCYKHNFPCGLCFCCRSSFFCFFIRGSQ